MADLSPHSGAEVGLTDMLNARERRAARQKEMLKKGGSLISFTLNIAGPIKRAELTDSAFYRGYEAIAAELTRRGWGVKAHRKTDAPTGLEAMWLLDAPAQELKRAMVAIEQGHDLGRLFDIDVLDSGGEAVGRRELNLPPRGCIVCGLPGPGCARSRAHSMDELRRVTLDMITAHIDSQLAARIAQNALRAMLYEVTVTPKPGLVDRGNSGAHSDMDFFTFIDSAASLSGYFRDMALAGCRSRDTAPEHLLRRLRYRGILAESEMLKATGGVNTHKGMIFSLGLVAAACGYLGDTAGGRDAGTILSLVAKIAAPAIEGDLAHLSPESAQTAGERLYTSRGIFGVRGEAAAGFPAVKELGLPLVRRLTAGGWPYEQAGVAVLLHLIAEVEDTNLIHRSSAETRQKIALDIKKWLTAAPRTADDYMKKALLLDSEFISRNLSPGGCADLLALTFMLHFMGEE